MTEQHHYTEAEKVVQLTRLSNYGTDYEYLLTDGNGNSYNLGYGRHSRAGLVDALRSRWDNVEKVTGIKAWKREKGMRLISEDGTWNISITGRTLRDCICEGCWPGIDRD
jgi:hypothetical protein